MSQPNPQAEKAEYEHELKKKVMHANGTPYSDENWKAWYAHRSNKEAFLERLETEQEN